MWLEYLADPAEMETGSQNMRSCHCSLDRDEVVRVGTMSYTAGGIGFRRLLVPAFLQVPAVRFPLLLQSMHMVASLSLLRDSVAAGPEDR